MTTDTTDRIGRLLNPRSIAVVGASQAQSKLAGQIIPMLTANGFTGKIFPVNPRYSEVAGLPCYASLRDVPDSIDHCVVIVSRDRVNAVLEDCAALGVPGGSIYSSGYAEVDEVGHRAQEDLRRAARDMVFLGPNCMGFANLVHRVFATTAAVLEHDSALGDVAIVSQSGGLAFATLAYYASQMGINLTYLVNTGNTAGISYRDLVAYLFEDDATKVVLTVAESEIVAAEVLSAVRDLGLAKPVVLLKLGRGDTGVRMAQSHTGALAGDYAPIRDCAEQLGIVCVDDVDEALHAADLLRHGFRPEDSDGLAAICISGGNVALLADMVDASELEFAVLSESSRAKLRTVLPEFVAINNPVDITALGYEQPELHREVLQVLADDASVRCLVPILTTTEDYSVLCSLLADAAAAQRLPLIVLWTGGSYDEKSVQILREAGIPVFKTANALVRTLTRMRSAVVMSTSVDVSDVAPAAVKLPKGVVTESAAYQFLSDAGVPVPEWEACSRAELAAAAARVGYPVVIKIDSATTHISDSGGVIVGVRTPEDLSARSAEIELLPESGLLVAQFLPGAELIASTFVHPHLGLLLMVGSGGVLAEILADVAFVRLPVARVHIERLLKKTIIGGTLASGHRGAEGFDAAVDALERLSAAALGSASSISQIELNPITVGSHGAAAVDAAVMSPAPSIGVSCRPPTR